MNDRAGNALYTLGALNEGATLGLNMALEVAKIMLNFDVFESAVVLANGTGGFWDAMNIVVSLNPIGKLGKVAGKIGRAFKWMNRAGDAGRLAGKAAEHLFKILPYKQASALTRRFNHEIEAHHILEVRHARRSGLNINDLPAVILPKGKHDEITAALRRELPYAAEYTADRVRQAYQRVYRGFPEWLQAIERYLR